MLYCLRLKLKGYKNNSEKTLYRFNINKMDTRSGRIHETCISRIEADKLKST